MAEAAVRESLTLAGRAERARLARRFVGEVLGPGHPCEDVAVLLVRELFGNSGSAAPEGTATVTVTASGGIVRVEVADRSGPGAPKLRLADGDAEGGRGLRLAARWGWQRCGGPTVTWFERRHGLSKRAA